jgi:hypothetical protein
MHLAIAQQMAAERLADLHRHAATSRVEATLARRRRSLLRQLLRRRAEPAPRVVADRPARPGRTEASTHA